jgi:hypothetical protein
MIKQNSYRKSLLRGASMTLLWGFLLNMFILPVHANLTPIWGWWTFLHFKELSRHSGYVFFFPGYALFYGLMTLMCCLIIRWRIPALTFFDLFKNVLNSTLISTFIGFLLSFPAYYLIEKSYYGFFDPTHGAIQNNSPVGILLFGVMWALFLGVFSFALSYKREKRSLMLDFEKNHWENKGVTKNQLNIACLYSSGLSHVFFLTLTLLVGIVRGDFNISGDGADHTPVFQLKSKF